MKEGEKWKGRVMLEEIGTKISWPTLHYQILFEDCLAWRGNQESRTGLAWLWATLSYPDHISSVLPPPRLSLSSIPCQELPPHKQPYQPRGRKSEEIDPCTRSPLCHFQEEPLLHDRTTSRYLVLGSQLTEGVGPGCLYTLCPCHCSWDYVTFDWQVGWSPWAGQQQDHKLFTGESINHNLG